MVEIQNPLIVMPFESREFARKPGGGGKREPIVSITPSLVADLAAQIDVAVSEANRRESTATNPLPVKVTLRPRALAKSNRPYVFLSQSGLPVTAAGSLGQLVVEATSGSLRNLKAAIESARTSDDLYWVSTIEKLGAWSLIEDVLSCASRDEAERKLGELRASAKTVRLEFFPWTTRSDFRPRKFGIASQSRGAIEPVRAEGIVETVRNAGLVAIEMAGSPSRPIVFAEASDSLTLESLAQLDGIRSASAVPSYTAIDQPISTSSFRLQGQVPSNPLRQRPDGIPVVGLLDSGIDSAHLGPYVVDRVDYDVSRRQDKNHGTFVAGLLADAVSLNGDSSIFPPDQCRVIDFQVLPDRPIDERELFARIDEAVRTHAPSGVRVWNCSFGSSDETALRYGSLAQDLDNLSDEFGVLFVIASGNCVSEPMRTWPPTRGIDYGDSLGTPGEAVRALTVGARAHLGGAVPVGSPSSYSRRGPSFARHVKPDLSHWAGDVGETGALDGHGTNSLAAGDFAAESVGTSFAAPLVTSIAANVWHSIAEQSIDGPPPPELIRGLLIHAASVSNQAAPEAERDYSGWGIPSSSADILGDTPDRFTSIHDVRMVPGNNWIRRPFPVPPALLDSAGKFVGRAILTISYAPPVNPAFGDELLRYDVGGSFGRYVARPDGAEAFKYLVSADGKRRGYWESDRVDDGKWSPVKSAAKSHPQGVAGGDWALRLELTERMSQEFGIEQRVFAIVTLQSLSGSDVVYRQGVNEARRLAYRSSPVVSTASVSVRLT